MQHFKGRKEYVLCIVMTLWCYISSELAFKMIPLSYNIMNPMTFPSRDMVNMLIFISLPASYLFALDSWITMGHKVKSIHSDLIFKGTTLKEVDL